MYYEKDFINTRNSPTVPFSPADTPKTLPNLR